VTEYRRILLDGAVVQTVREGEAPFGGSKKSGIGRDGGTWSFDFYADIKNTVVSPNGWKK